MTAPRDQDIASTADYSLLVSSCDAYADCWEPFFALLARYWRSCPVIYLNTETSSYSWPSLDIRCPRPVLARGPLDWGARLRECLAHVETDIVLYLQEDYFINDTVDVATINSLVSLMRREDVSHIRLVPGALRGEPTGHPFVSRTPQRAEYRVSMQAGLWKTNAIAGHLRAHETVWELEWYGTRRAWRRSDTFLHVDRAYEETHGRMVVPYWPTGVVHGRWVRPVVEDLFAEHGIAVDFSGRGFYDPDDDDWGRSPLLRKAVRRLRSL